LSYHFWIFIWVSPKIIELAVSDLAIYVAIAAVIITLVGIIWANKRTKESIEITQKEIKSRVRPWIKIEDTSPEFATLANGTTVSWQRFIDKRSKYGIPKLVIFGTHIENVGQAPSTDVRFYFLEEENEVKRENLMNVSEVLNTFAMMPGERRHISSNLSYELWEKSNQDHFYIGYRFDYDVDGKTNTTAKIWEIDGALSRIKDSWIIE